MRGESDCCLSVSGTAVERESMLARKTGDEFE